MSLEKDITDFSQKRKNTISKKNKKNLSEDYIKKVSDLCKEGEELLKNIPESEKTQINKVEIEMGIILEEFAEVLFSKDDFEQCIQVDRRLIRIDDKHHQSFARLYKCYLKVGQDDNAALFGSMLIGKFSPKIQEEFYSDLIPKIKETIKNVSENFKNQSIFQHVKFTPWMYIKLFFFIVSCFILVYGFYTGDIWGKKRVK